MKPSSKTSTGFNKNPTSIKITADNKKHLVQNHELITTAEVMKMFGVCKKTVYRWRDKGQLLAVKFGGTYYYSKTLIEISLRSKWQRQEYTDEV